MNQFLVDLCNAMGIEPKTDNEGRSTLAQLLVEIFYNLNHGFDIDNDPDLNDTQKEYLHKLNQARLISLGL